MTPPWKIERAALGELDRNDAATVDAAALAVIADSNRDILAALPPPMVAAEVTRRAAKIRAAKKKARSRRRWLLAASMAAAAALCLVWAGGLVPGATTPPPASTDQKDLTTRIKGTPHLVIYRKRAAAIDPLQPGSAVTAGDLLQVSYVAAGRAYGVILSIDGRGTVTVHYPRAAADAAPLDQRGVVSLDHSFLLDDAPDIERFFFVVSRQPFAVEVATRAAARLAASPAPATAPLSLPAGIEQVPFPLRKVDSP